MSDKTRKSLPILDQGGGAIPMDRRQALKVIAIAAAGPTLASCAPGEAPVDATIPAPTSNPKAAGTAWDPDLVAPSVSWERTLSADELASLTIVLPVRSLRHPGSSQGSQQKGTRHFPAGMLSGPLLQAADLFSLEIRCRCSSMGGGTSSDVP